MFTVLNIDDDKCNRTIVSLMLKNKCSDVDIIDCINGQEAIDKYIELKGKVDLVISDYHMPIKDGKETLTEMRSKGYDESFVILTSDCMADSKVFPEATYVKYKPLTKEVIDEVVVNGLCRKCKKTKAVGEKCMGASNVRNY